MDKTEFLSLSDHDKWLNYWNATDQLAATKEKLARAEKVVSESAYYFSLDTLENSHKEFWEAEQNVKLAIKAYREVGSD